MVDDSVHVYDFDKTLTYRDTLYDFFQFAARPSETLAVKRLLYVVCMVLTKLGLMQNGHLKSIGIRLFLSNLDEDEFAEKASSYKDRISYNQLFRQTDFGSLVGRVYIISASFVDYLRPIFPENVEVIASTIERENGSPRRLCNNLYGDAKAQALRNLGIEEIDVFYTDSVADLPLVKMSKQTICVRGDEIFTCADEKEFLNTLNS